MIELYTIHYDDTMKAEFDNYVIGLYKNNQFSQLAFSYSYENSR